MPEGARPATVDDDEAIIAMCLALYVEDPSPRNPGRAQIERTLARFRDEPHRGQAVVLVDDEAPADVLDVVGYAFLASFWSNEVGGEICTIDELYVKPDARGRGHASRFIGALVLGRVARFADAVALDLEVTPANARARALYERMGFCAWKNAPMRRLR